MSPCFFILAWKNHTYGKGVVMADWAKIKAEYIRDQSSSYRSLAKKYGVTKDAICNKAKKEGWIDLRRQRIDKTATAVVDACATKEAEKAIRIYEIADIAMEVILGKLIAGGLLPQDVKSLTGALKDIAAVKGIQTDAERREQEARIAKLRREAERDQEQENQEIVFRITGMSDEEVQGVIG